jgi:NADH-quinone oxidoreductase subunit E
LEFPPKINLNHQDLFVSFSGDPENLIPLLQKVQEVQGYISPESVRELSRFTRLSENEIYGVASFFAMFRFHSPGRNLIKICLGTACHVQGAPLLVDSLSAYLGIHPGETTPDGKFELEQVACLGCCALSPVMQVNRDIYSKVTSSRIKEILDKYE